MVRTLSRSSFRNSPRSSLQPKVLSRALSKYRSLHTEHCDSLSPSVVLSPAFTHMISLQHQLFSTHIAMFCPSFSFSSDILQPSFQFVLSHVRPLTPCISHTLENLWLSYRLLSYCELFSTPNTFDTLISLMCTSFSHTTHLRVAHTTTRFHPRSRTLRDPQIFQP